MSAQNENPAAHSGREALISTSKKDVEVLLRAAYKSPQKTASARTLEPSALKRACSRWKDKFGFPGTLSFHNEACGLHTQSNMPIFKLTVTVSL
jgi:hypothetical protein